MVFFLYIIWWCFRLVCSVVQGAGGSPLLTYLYLIPMWNFVFYSWFWTQWKCDVYMYRFCNFFPPSVIFFSDTLYLRGEKKSKQINHCKTVFKEWIGFCFGFKPLILFSATKQLKNQIWHWFYTKAWNTWYLLIYSSTASESLSQLLPWVAHAW